MNRFYHIIGVALLCWLTYLLTAGQSSSFPGSRTEETTGPSELARWGVRTRGPAGQDPRTQARIDKLSGLEIERGMRDRATANMQEARIVLRLQKNSAWIDMLTANWQAFQTLRRHAVESPTGETPCTLCDGTGSMEFCVLCEHDHGKCLTCGGTGRTPSGGYCPSCLGKGKCYLCGGTGKMTCPFCDDGIVSLKLPPPPATMPLE